VAAAAVVMDSAERISVERHSARKDGAASRKPVRVERNGAVAVVCSAVVFVQVRSRISVMPVLHSVRAFAVVRCVGGSRGKAIHGVVRVNVTFPRASRPTTMS